MNAFPYYRVSAADPRQRGRQLGAAARDAIHRTLEFYGRYFEEFAGLNWSRVRRVAVSFAAPIAAYDATILAEMEGIAAGAAVEVEDVLAINARTEILYGLTG